jgi:single-strand selective monofunctional uracil DNA glycosylase
MQNLFKITDDLLEALAPLEFSHPVTHIYNPLKYARPAYDEYLKRYGGKPKEVLLLGMNPGPWGMVQTGIPFGEISAVRDWMGIQPHHGVPRRFHPKRPVEGFLCKRREVSGTRLWGWAESRFGTPENFFSRFFVANYCPLMFLEESGRNRTPNQIPVAERKSLLAPCDQALRETVLYFQPRHVVGIGAFAADRAKAALGGVEVTVGRITHPSPANPKANKGWEDCILKEFTQMGIEGVGT